MTELPRRDEEGIEQLLGLRVPCLGIDKDFADKLYRPLHRVGLTDILSLCDEDRADHIGGCGDVQQESFLIG